MSRMLKRRLEKLESRRSKQKTNRVLNYDPRQPLSKVEAMEKCGQGRVWLFPDFGTMEEWEAALKKQQET